MDDFVFSHEDRTLSQDGEEAKARHFDRIRGKIKGKLPDVIGNESIINADGKKIIRVPVKSDKEYYFRHGTNNRDFIGNGDGESAPGDILQHAKPPRGTGKRGAGNEAGDEDYEVAMTLDELALLMFEDFGLPYMDPEKQPELVTEEIRFDDIRKKGIMSNLDRKRTIQEIMKRNARETGKADLSSISKDDLRFITWTEKEKPSTNAVVFAMMDVSGSMDDERKYLARVFFFWMVRFLRHKYDKVQVVFIAHDTHAKEVSEEDFFSRVEGGGTMCSSAWELCRQIIQERFPPNLYNLYPFHFSDGDNWGEDNTTCAKLVNAMCDTCNAVGYAEVTDVFRENYRNNQSAGEPIYSTLYSVLQKFIAKDNFTAVYIKDREAVYPALRKFFSLEEATKQG